MANLPSTTSQAGFTYLDHTADVWVHAWGPTLEATISQCVYGLMDTMLDNWEDIEELEKYSFKMEDESKGALLISFLSEFLFLFDTEGWVFRRVDISAIQKTTEGYYQLIGTGYGDRFDPVKYLPDTEVKAITYSYLEINETSDRTEIKIVYDI